MAHAVGFSVPVAGPRRRVVLTNWLEQTFAAFVVTSLFKGMNRKRLSG
jgi:hypothetical protein